MHVSKIFKMVFLKFKMNIKSNAAQCFQPCTDPAFGKKLVNVGGGPAFATVKVTPLEAKPPTVTVTGPVVAPDGTCAVRLVAVADSVVALTPLKRI